MEGLKLAIKAGIPLIYVRTDDVINVERVLTHIAGEQVKPWRIPEVITSLKELKEPDPNSRVYYTSVECKSLVKLYHYLVGNEKTIVFVNTDRSVLQFDGGDLTPPKELVHEFISEFAEDPDALLPSFGGMTLKDVGEVARMTMTRDESLTPRGISSTRRGYRNLKGIIQVDTGMSFYLEPSYLNEWLEKNTQFFQEPLHEALMPRGLLFGGPPGTGKTGAAKHIAATFGVPLYRLDVGAMKGKYVGESESNLIAALNQVDQVEPCVVIFDEVEKIFQSQGDSGVTSSLLSQLLWWLQEHKTRVFTVMTTNDMDKIPVELYREGRIDAHMEFLGVESVKEAQEFACGAFKNMVSELGAEGDFSSLLIKLKKQVSLLYVDGDAVPQAKLTQVAYNMVKEGLSGG